MKFLKPSLVALAVVALAGCGQEAEKAPEKTVLETPEQKQSYAMGSSLGKYLQTNLDKQAEIGLPLDRDLVIKGFNDFMAGQGQMNDEEIQALLMDMQATMRAKGAEKQQAELAKNLEEGQKFLADNKANNANVQVTESGLQYEVLTEGEGDKPQATDTVRVHYKGMLLDGQEFDSSYSRNKPTVFPLNRVIKGWTEGVQLMSVGSKYKFVIPSDLAYGPSGNPPRIPGNSTLIFEIELLEIVPPAVNNPVQVGDK